MIRAGPTAMGRESTEGRGGAGKAAHLGFGKASVLALQRAGRMPCKRQAADAYRDLMKLVPYQPIGEAGDVGQAAVWLTFDAPDCRRVDFYGRRHESRSGLRR